MTKTNSDSALPFNGNQLKKCINVALIGRPSAGKSTFLNTVLGTYLSVVASTPQTTRRAIRGIYTDERGQIVFTDTPGVSDFDKRSNEISRLALKRLKSSEAILYIVDAFDNEGKESERLNEILSDIHDKPIIVLINKCDSAPREKIEERKKNIISSLGSVTIFEISALKDEGIDEVLIELFKHAENREMEYDESVWTDETLDDRVSEIIRGAAVGLLKHELPHVVEVALEDMEYRSGIVWIRAFLMVERESQKGIVIGKGGKMIRDITNNALVKLRSVFPDVKKVDLDLRVAVH